MMHELPCDVVRDRLEAFHDGEVPFSERLAIQGHMEDCVTCSLANEALIDLTAQITCAVDESPESCEPLRFSASVVERLNVEEQFSMASQVRGLFQDMHLVWAAIGASIATLICIIGSVSVLHAANQERPESLAALISLLANPGSNANPVRLDTGMVYPRAITNPAIEMGEEDAAFALSASVSREGRVQGVSVIDEQSGVTRAVVNAMLNEAYRVRFAPAQARTGDTVAVNMVWLVANTTVKGRHIDEVLVRRTLRARSAPRPIRPVPILNPDPEPESESGTTGKPIVQDPMTLSSRTPVALDTGGN